MILFEALLLWLAKGLSLYTAPHTAEYSVSGYGLFDGFSQTAKHSGDAGRSGIGYGAGGVL